MTSSSFDSTLANLGIGRSGSAATPTVQTQAQSQTLDQSDFLALMTAQLKNQDPFSPVDNTQMVAQMAQFSSVAGISQMNTTLSSIADKLGAGSASDALSYVGRTVLTAGSTAYARAMGASPLLADTPAWLLVGSNVLEPAHWKSALLSNDSSVEITNLQCDKRPTTAYVDGVSQGAVRSIRARLSRAAAVELVFLANRDMAEKIAGIQFMR